MSARESFYLCRFTSPRAHRTSHVRAWDEKEAVQVFRSELSLDQLDEAGTIEVIGSLGRPSLQMKFDPHAAH